MSNDHLEKSSHDVTQRYQDALAAFISKAEQDPYILAVILFGSLSYDVVWERSDIDLCVVTQDIKLRAKAYSLVENGISIHALLQTRSELKKLIEGSIGSSFMHSLFSKGQIVYSRDCTINDLYEKRTYLGERDKEINLLSEAAHLVPSLVKARKFLIFKHNTEYGFLWLTKCLDRLAALEVVSQGEIATREVVLQALQLSPNFFAPLYKSLIHNAKTDENLLIILESIENYLIEKSVDLFKLIFDYLHDIGGARSTTDINNYFEKNYGISVDLVCEWLADMDIIDRVASPVRLTDRSRVDFDEAAYYYDRDDEH